MQNHFLNPIGIPTGTLIDIPIEISIESHMGKMLNNG
jgi:hypothetical protein